MPVWDKAAFDTFYSSGAERYGHPGVRPQIRLHYHWYPIIQWQRSSYAPRLFAVLNMVAGDSVVLVGAGFNGTGAGLERLGINVTGTETSTYINAEKSNTEEAEVRDAIIAVGLDPDNDTIIGPPGNVRINLLDLLLDGGRAAPKVRAQATVVEEDFSTRGSRNRVDSTLPSRARFILSEEVLNSGTDAEALTVCERMARYASENGGTVVHMLSPLFPGKTQAPELNWKTYAGWRSFLNTNGFSAQLILPTVTARDQGMFMPDHETVRLNVLAGELARGHGAAVAAATALAVADEHVASNRVIAYSGVF